MRRGKERLRKKAGGKRKDGTKERRAEKVDCDIGQKKGRMTLPKYDLGEGTVWEEKGEILKDDDKQ